MVVQKKERLVLKGEGPTLEVRRDLLLVVVDHLFQLAEWLVAGHRVLHLLEDLLYQAAELLAVDLLFQLAELLVVGLLFRLAESLEVDHHVLDHSLVAQGDQMTLEASARRWMVAPSSFEEGARVEILYDEVEAMRVR